MSTPVICFGQQPCGFFPKRFLAAKIAAARRLRAQIGGEIVFFYHDSDHDPRETQTLLRHHTSGEVDKLNFQVESKVQRKWSPLYLKRIQAGWSQQMARRLGAYVDQRCLAAFKAASSDLVADFCLETYAALGLLEGLRLVRSSDPAVRRAACAIEDYFVDLPYEGEIVRARRRGDGFAVHEGGSAYLEVPPSEVTKEQVSPTRDSRLRWMQSVIKCTHYVAGAGERAYLNTADAPDITFVDRDPIDRSDEAYIEFPT